MMEILCRIFKDRKLTNNPSTRDISRTSIHIFQSEKVTNNNFSGGIKWFFSDSSVKPQINNKLLYKPAADLAIFIIVQ